MMLVKKTSFIKSGTKPEHYPPAELPEIAFVGRSNAGKSSLMNSLMYRRDLVRVSNTPGRTQLLSWFSVNDQMLLCDLPGYGFAKVPPALRQRWGPMVNTYLSSRENLLALVVLADVRRGFAQEEFDLMSACVSFDLQPVLVATKCDKLSQAQLYRRKQQLGEALRCDPETDIVWTSATTHLGRDRLWARLSALLPSGHVA